LADIVEKVLARMLWSLFLESIFCTAHFRKRRSEDSPAQKQDTTLGPILIALPTFSTISAQLSRLQVEKLDPKLAIRWR
jgi:hypothetical protein